MARTFTNVLKVGIITNGAIEYFILFIYRENLVLSLTFFTYEQPSTAVLISLMIVPHKGRGKPGLYPIKSKVQCPFSP